MNAENSIKKMLMVAFIIMLGFSGRALADPGMMGYRYGYGGGYPMHEWHHGGFGGTESGYWGQLSEEQIQKLYAEQSAFFEATRDLRDRQYQKRLELRSELAKENPDAQKAAALQKEISQLKADQS
jgi:zinc resistance-associated protein